MITFGSGEFGARRVSAPRRGRRRAAFLDRDGVLIENRDDYVRCVDDVRLVPGACEGARLLQAAGFALVIVSNQACVGKGIISKDCARGVHDHVVETLAQQGVLVLASYLCPHPGEAGCACRKPGAGLLYRAAFELDLDLSRSVLVGDAWSDIDAAHTAGVAPLLVRTGRGARQWREASMERRASVCGVAASLRAAACLIVGGA